MSAYLCSPRHVKVCAKAIWDAELRTLRKTVTVEDVAEDLARENLKSVASRYAETEDQVAAPIMAMSQSPEGAADQYIQACRHEDTPEAKRYLPEHLFQFLSCLEYQSNAHSTAAETRTQALMKAARLRYAGKVVRQVIAHSTNESIWDVPDVGGTI